MDWEPVLTTLRDASIPILTALFTAIGSVLIAYLEKLRKKATQETTKIQDKNLQETVNNAINRIESLARTTVMCIQQELVNDIKQGILNGTNTREELFALKEQAVENVMAQLTPELKAQVSNQIADIQAYVGNLISSYVFELRLTTNSLPTLQCPEEQDEPEETEFADAVVTEN